MCFYFHGFPLRSVRFRKVFRKVSLKSYETSAVFGLDFCATIINIIQQGNFTYTGIDLFGDDNEDNEEKKPTYIKHQKFSNPLKHIYYNFYLKENLNSLESVKKFLKNFENKV